MATNGRANDSKTKVEPHNALKVSTKPGVDTSTTLANVALRPSVRAAVSVQRFVKPEFGDVDLTALADELSSQITTVTGGDLRRAEAMLIAQAHVLEGIFHELARRAGLNMGEYLQAAETYMRLALKAQSQCRATLETLVTMKNPPVAFVRQANIAHGPQQVNNAPAVDAPRARESEIAPNELLEVTDGKRLDAGATTPAVGADSDVEAVGPIDRA